MTDRHPTLLLGAYVLDTLEPRERAEVDAHLRDCPACTAEVAELAPLRAILDSVDADDVAALDAKPSPELFARMVAAADAEDSPVALAPSASAVTPLSTVGPLDGSRPVSNRPVSNRPGDNRPGRRPRRRRTRLLVAAAVALIALAGAGTGIAIAVSAPNPTTVSAVAAGVRMTAQLQPVNTGTTLHVTVAGLPEGEQCTLIAVGRDGSRHNAGEWVAAYDGRAQITTATDLAPDRLGQLVLLGTTGQTLVTIRL